jgi:TetR/AcrR family transcriptional repressor of nem operon
MRDAGLGDGRMVRIVKEHAVRRNEILDATERLVYTKGYEQMAIQDILNELQIAKGTVYHYFDSKLALVEAMIERTMDEIEKLLLPIVHDPECSALDKFQRFFASLNTYRAEQKPVLLKLLRVWYTDDNALVRQKARVVLVKRVKPLLTVIIQQGVQEGVLTTRYPDQVSEVVLSLQQGIEETLARLFLLAESKLEDLQQAESIIATYIDALERVLGAPRDSLHPVDIEMLKEWIVSL